MAVRGVELGQSRVGPPSHRGGPFRIRCDDGLEPSAAAPVDRVGHQSQISLYLAAARGLFFAHSSARWSRVVASETRASGPCPEKSRSP